MSVRILCDRCGAEDMNHWRNVKVDMQRGQYGETRARQEIQPWYRTAHLCGYCSGQLREWWQGEHNTGREPRDG